MPSLTIKLSPRLSARVARLAKSRRLSKSEVVRQAIEALTQADDDTVVARYGHLFGAGKTGPRDLATNPKYLAGFGT